MRWVNDADHAFEFPDRLQVRVHPMLRIVPGAVLEAEIASLRWGCWTEPRQVVGIEATIPGGSQSAGASSPMTACSSSRSASLAIDASEK